MFGMKIFSVRLYLQKNYYKIKLMILNFSANMWTSGQTSDTVKNNFDSSSRVNFSEKYTSSSTQKLTFFVQSHELGVEVVYETEQALDLTMPKTKTQSSPQVIIKIFAECKIVMFLSEIAAIFTHFLYCNLFTRTKV